MKMMMMMMVTAASVRTPGSPPPSGQRTEQKSSGHRITAPEPRVGPRPADADPRRPPGEEEAEQKRLWSPDACRRTEKRENRPEGANTD